MSEIKSLLNDIDPNPEKTHNDYINTQYNVPVYEYVYDPGSKNVKTKKLDLFGTQNPKSIYYDPSGDRVEKYIKERYINAPTTITKTIASETPRVAADIVDTIFEEFTDLGDNTLFYMNKYNPARATGEYPLPDEKNIYFNQDTGKGKIRTAWDYYRNFGGLISEQAMQTAEPQTAVGDFTADVGAYLIPWTQGMKIVKTPELIKKGGNWLDQAYKWAISGAAVDFIYGAEDNEDQGLLTSLTGFSATEQSGLKQLMHNSFLSGEDAEQFANRLDYSISGGISSGLFSVGFSGLGHIFKSSYYTAFPQKAVEGLKKSFIREHGIKATKFIEKLNEKTIGGLPGKRAIEEYVSQPAVAKWLEQNSKIWFRKRIKANDLINSLKSKEVFYPPRIGNGNPFANGYPTFKENILKVYKRMLANRNPLMLYLPAAGVLGYALFQPSEAQAGVLDKAIQRYFAKGGQKLFTRGSGNKLIPVTHDDVLAMPMNKEVYIQPQDAKGEWVIYQSKEEFLASEDALPANPIDLLPNVNEPYYNTLAQKIEAMNFETMPKEQFINTISNMQGIKKEEIETTQLFEFVEAAEGDVISKRDLLSNWYETSQIKVRTRLMGSDTGSGEMEEAYGRYEDYRTPGDYDKYKEHLITYKPLTSPEVTAEFEKRKLNLNDIVLDLGFQDGTFVVRRTGSAEVVDEGDMTGRIAGPTVDKIIQETGLSRAEVIASNFFELNPKYELILKQGMLEQINKDILEEIKKDFGVDYKSSHFREPNILAHTRTTERDIDGNPTFFIEEVQSDMHQQGMKLGYRNTDEYIALKKRYDELIKLLDKVRTHIDAGGSYDSVPAPNYEKIKREFAEVSGKLDRFNQRLPDAPFKNEKDWVSLALKEMVYFAALRGYDQIAWTSGHIQNERYGIGQYVDELIVKPANDPQYEDAYILIGNQGDNTVFNETVISQNENRDVLVETVGKSLADKIRKGEKEAPEEFKKFGLKFSGLELNLAGEGKTLDRFYDKLVPSVLDKLYKKDGVQFGTTTLETAVDAKPAPFEEMQDDLYMQAQERVAIEELTENQILNYNDRNPLYDEVIKKEGFKIWGLVQDDFVVDAQSFEIADAKRGDASDRAMEHFQDQEMEAIHEIQGDLYQTYVDDFSVEAQDSVERMIMYMTIPEALKDRILKLGQPLFGTNPNKLGTYENKTTQ